MSALHSNGSSAEDICLTCGLCCNGVIFANLRLQPGDRLAELHALGLPVMVARRNGDTPYDPAEEKPPIRQCRLSQPCAAYDGCRCRIYSERPQHCRNFDCALLAQLRAGNVQRRTALSKIRLARRLVQQVINSLRQFGDTDEHLALATRFRRTSQRLEAVGLEKALASRYGELTLAFHDLSLVLSTSFYPGPVR